MAGELDDSGSSVLQETEREVLGWLEFGEAARHLAGEVVESGFEPDLVVAIARGGLLLAGAIAGRRLVGTVGGTGRDGTPACATVVSQFEIRRAS